MLRTTSSTAWRGVVSRKPRPRSATSALSTPTRRASRAARPPRLSGMILITINLPGTRHGTSARPPCQEEMRRDHSAALHPHSAQRVAICPVARRVHPLAREAVRHEVESPVNNEAFTRAVGTDPRKISSRLLADLGPTNTGDLGAPESVVRFAAPLYRGSNTR